MTTLRAALLAGALPALAAAQDLTLIPGFSVDDLAGSATPTAYGDQDGVGAASWSPTLGFSAYPGASTIVRASQDGAVLAGKSYLVGGAHAQRWTAATGWVSLPQPPGTLSSLLEPKDMSADGATIVGVAQQPDSEYVAWRWTASGGVGLIDDSTSLDTFAWCVSGDGAWVGGRRTLLDGSPGRAVRWNSIDKASWIFTASFPHGTTTESTLRVLNHDGSRGAGSFGLDAFIWEQGVGPALLPRPPHSDGDALAPVAMADDGSCVVGHVVSGDAAAWIWTPDQGTRWTADVAAQLRLDPGDAQSPWVYTGDCDADGRRLAGISYDPADGWSSWILDLPADGVGLVVDLKKALSGDTTPKLDAFGSFTGGSEALLRVGDLVGLGKTTHLVIGLTNLNAHFKGGWMVPNPDLVVTFAAPNTKVDIPLPWPDHVPAGTSLYFQVWQPQPGGPVGWAASNALQVVTP